MRLNEHTALSTKKTLLVPYCSQHVPTYHAWMQDADLQAATASEPLTLPEEYDMQQSWRTDNDKLTFIICLPQETANEMVQSGKDDGPERMVGDINLFLLEPEDDDDDDEGANSNSNKKSTGMVGEIELMIARKDLHRQGYGRAALLAFTSYVLDSWAQIAAEYSTNSGSESSRPLDFLRVKINQTNERSIALFESVGFVRTAAGANYFGEVELRWRPDRSEMTGFKGWEEAKILEYTVA